MKDTKLIHVLVIAVIANMIAMLLLQKIQGK